MSGVCGEMKEQLVALIAGAESAALLFDAIEAANSAMSSDKERLAWWVGFFSAIGEFSTGCIGQSASDAIVAAIAGKIATTDIRGKAH